MICYKDMTFCPFYEDCSNAAACDRPLTPEISKAAADFGLPTAQYTAKPQCHSDNEEKS